MTCYSIVKEGKHVGFLCGDFGPHCTECSQVGDEFLCDYPVGKGKTCDKGLCADHAHEVAPNVHYCPGHHAEFEKFRAEGGVKAELENVVPFKDKAC
jgi:hypothetical protein